MANRLQGKVAMVVGAGSIGPGWGNGKAAAVLYAREGATVLALDLNEAAARETVKIIEGEGGKAVARQVNAAKAKEVEAAVRFCASELGRLDVLHNNVGIASLGGPVEVSEEEWDRVMAINLKSVFLACKYALPVMVAQGKGAIVNIASIAGIRYTGVPYITYSTTKGAILPFTRAIALEYARQGIRANSILPGLMDTPMIYAGLQAAYSSSANKDEMVKAREAQCPMGRMGDAWDVAYAALFLASDEARYITGTELVVDGGITAKYA
jgi:NAD(P)-dependent dehydrogenase (short-subunit alcohol dehydrogenase family)